MIRYSIAQADLEAAIEQEKPGWLDRAQIRAQAFVAAGRYNEASSIWSEVKPVYMRLQHEKCAYCDRKLASADFGGNIEHDLEHYRPKNTVEPWPSTTNTPGIVYTFKTGARLPNGYYWLAYDPLNYCVACKKCNSPLKSNYFPIAAKRGKAGAVPLHLNKTEQPLLIFPIGDLDEDPSQLIGFMGINPIPRKKNGPRRRRANITIQFFKLDTREELLRERAEQLVALDNALRLIESNPSPEAKNNAREDIKIMRHASTRHCACVRAACDFYIKDPVRARELFARARGYLKSLLASQ